MLKCVCLHVHLSMYVLVAMNVYDDKYLYDDVLVQIIRLHPIQLHSIKDTHMSFRPLLFINTTLHAEILTVGVEADLDKSMQLGSLAIYRKCSKLLQKEGEGLGHA